MSRKPGPLQIIQYSPLSPHFFLGMSPLPGGGGGGGGASTPVSIFPIDPGVEAGTPCRKHTPGNVGDE
jgi:hypothetical protein